MRDADEAVASRSNAPRSGKKKPGGRTQWTFGPVYERAGSETGVPGHCEDAAFLEMKACLPCAVVEVN